MPNNDDDGIIAYQQKRLAEFKMDETQFQARHEIYLHSPYSWLSIEKSNEAETILAAIESYRLATNSRDYEELRSHCEHLLATVPISKPARVDIYVELRLLAAWRITALSAESPQ